MKLLIRSLIINVVLVSLMWLKQVTLVSVRTQQTWCLLTSWHLLIYVLTEALIFKMQCC